MMSGTRVSNPAAVAVNPWRIMKVRKKLEANGRFLASSVGAEPGFLTSSGSAAMIPDERETIKKECMTWKMK